jgi:hypothetical protein
MNFETHLILQEDPALNDSWTGLIDDDWILELMHDGTGRVTDAIIRKNGVDWVLPCDDRENICRCIQLSDYTDALEDACPYAEPVLSFESWTGIVGGDISADDLLEAASVARSDDDGLVNIDRLKRPWICATDAGPEVIYDGSSNAKAPLQLPLSL